MTCLQTATDPLSSKVCGSGSIQTAPREDIRIYSAESDQKQRFVVLSLLFLVCFSALLVMLANGFRLYVLPHT
ncbi:hypothetical protein CEXT_500751 [Caerostris extrusa]|uniref:Uncharacterized protein n=1 Tax=Caerostris extrusa TaxID=172846 RepID=A0AAV4XDE1_CAEEX|nr:hypothetical protein CEXT_500751 [Caerostris extrusa]